MTEFDPAGLRTNLFIGGSWTSAKSRRRIDVVNPSTGEAITAVDDAEVHDGLSSVDAAASAQGAWAACGPRERGEILRRAYFWLEDPYRDGGISSFSHRKLRQLIKTPLLIGEHVRGLEAHVDQIIAEGTDFVRADPDYDGGITGVMKIARAAEGFGLDVEIHAAGPAQRHCMAAIRNTNYYELAPAGPGLGVTLNWDWITTSQTGVAVYE